MSLFKRILVGIVFTGVTALVVFSYNQYLIGELKSRETQKAGELEEEPAAVLARSGH